MRNFFDVVVIDRADRYVLVRSFFLFFLCGTYLVSLFGFLSVSD